MQLSDEFALASLQLVGMELTAKMLSNDNVEVNATMKDIALCDQQKHRQQKRTGYVTVASPVGGGTIGPFQRPKLRAVLGHGHPYRNYMGDTTW